MEVRLDKYLWAVRIFKTRSDAADAIRNNRVLVNDAYAKPSREVKVGDRLTVKRTLVTYSYLVVSLHQTLRMLLHLLQVLQVLLCSRDRTYA